MEQKPLDRLRCVVERITYQSDGYSVLKCAAKGHTDLVAVVGMMPDTHVGAVLTLGGYWKIDSKYGRQFEVVTFEETLPATVYGIEKYLGSGLIKGIGPKFAKLIVSTFGKDTLEVIETDPDQLISVPNIGRKRVESIKRGWAEQKEIKNIMLFLQGKDVSTAHATRIYKQYGAESIKVVEENPYRLADDIWGIGFKTADTIAAKLGIEKDRFIRLRSGLLYTLNKLAEDGHCYGTRAQLLETGAKLLDVDESLLSMTLDEMVRVKDVIVTPIPKDSPNSTEAMPRLLDEIAPRANPGVECVPFVGNSPLTRSRQYFENCFIQGDVDFIFGPYRCWFEGCTLFMNARGGWYTAANTPEEQPWGMVFHSCRLTGECQQGEAKLGRPWRAFARTLFLACDMDACVSPRGFEDWHNWDGVREVTERCGEWRTTGVRADLSQRHPRQKRLTDAEADGITPQKVLGGEWYKAGC